MFSTGTVGMQHAAAEWSKFGIAGAVDWQWNGVAPSCWFYGSMYNSYICYFFLSSFYIFKFFIISILLRQTDIHNCSKFPFLFQIFRHSKSFRNTACRLENAERLKAYSSTSK